MQDFIQKRRMVKDGLAPQTPVGSTMYKNLYILRKNRIAHPLIQKGWAFLQLPLRMIMLTNYEYLIQQTPLHFL